MKSATRERKKIEKETLKKEDFQEMKDHELFSLWFDIKIFEVFEKRDHSVEDYGEIYSEFQSKLANKDAIFEFLERQNIQKLS